MFQTDAIIESKIDIHRKCRAKRALSYFWRPFWNSLSEFWEKLKIKTFTIENVLKCMENVWNKF